MGVLFAFLCAVGYSISTIISKVSVNKSHSPIAVGTVFQLAGGIASLAFFFIDPPQVYNSTFQTWALLILSCLAYVVFTVFGFKANKLMEMSINSIFGQISMVFTFFASAILFREDLTWAKLLGIALLVLGNVLVIGSAWKHKDVDPKGLIFRALASLALTVATLMDAYNSANFSVSLYNFLEYFVAGVFTWILCWVSLKEIVEEVKTNWGMQLAMGGTAAVAYYFLIKAYTLAPKIVVVPIYNMTGIMTVLLGIVLLKESKGLKRKIIAAVLAFVGAVLLSV